MKAIIISYLVVIASCTELDDIAYDQFTLYKKFQYSGQIKTEGEYWAFDTINNVYKITFLYTDGSFFRGGTDEINNLFACDPIDDKVRDVPWWWGFFDIQNGQILFESVDPSSINMHSKYQVYKVEGEFILVCTLLRKALEARVVSKKHFSWKELILTPHDFDPSALKHPVTRQLMEKMTFEHGGAEYDAKYPDGIPTSIVFRDEQGQVF